MPTGTGDRADPGPEEGRTTPRSHAIADSGDRWRRRQDSAVRVPDQPQMGARGFAGRVHDRQTGRPSDPDLGNLEGPRQSPSEAVADTGGEFAAGKAAGRLPGGIAPRPAGSPFRGPPPPQKPAPPRA